MTLAPISIGSQEIELVQREKCSATVRDGQRYALTCIDDAWRPMNSQLVRHAKRVSGPGIVIEFSGSKGLLFYKTTQKHRQTKNADKYEQTSNQKARTDIKPDRFRTFFPPIIGAEFYAPFDVSVPEIHWRCRLILLTNWRASIWLSARTDWVRCSFSNDWRDDFESV